MLIQRAFRYELKPAPQQAALLHRFAGCRRFVYNKALAEQEARRSRGEKRLSYSELCTLLTAWKQTPEYAFLNDAPAQPLQQALKDLDRAYRNFFEKRAAPPRFKKRG